MMPGKRQEAHRSLELLEEYHSKLTRAEDRPLREAIERVIFIFKGRLFQALLELQEFYETTLLDDTKSIIQKTYETNCMADRWQANAPTRGTLVEDQRKQYKTRSDVIITTSTKIHTKPSSSRSPDPKSHSPLPKIVSGTNVANGTTKDHSKELSVTVSMDEWEHEEIILHRSTSGLGFSLSGGRDNPRTPNDPSIYVTKIIPAGAAEKDGRLKKDDIISRVNDVDFSNIPHSQAVDTLKNAGNVVKLQVRRRRSKSVSPGPISSPLSGLQRVERIELNKGSKGLGFSIAGGIGNEHVPGDNGIYITKIIEGGAAHLDGRIEAGDKLLAVGNTSLENVTHETAVAALKATSDRVVLTIAKTSPSSMGESYSLNDATGAAYSNIDAKKQRPQPYMDQNHVASKTTVPPPPSATGHSSVVPSSGGPVNITRAPRQVTLTKGPAGLGFNIVGGEDGEGIYVSYVVPGGVTELSGALFKGDQLLEVNNVNLRRATHEEAASALKNCGQRVYIVAQYQPEAFARFEAKLNRLRDELIQQEKARPQMPHVQQQPSPKRELYVRALFDYDPSRDSGLPSRGLAFNHGDILHVTNASDDDWWQARKVIADGVEEGYGIIPGKLRVEKRERARRKQVNFSGQQFGLSDKHSGSKRSLALSRRFPFMKSRERVGEESDYEKQEEPINSYEPVERKRLNYARPLVTLGPLKDRINDDLLSEFADRFGNCVPHTSRARREHETDGRDYHFVTKERMELDIADHKFIEAGQYNHNLYGTSVDSVKKVTEQGRHCILDVSGNALKRLHTQDLYPIAILIKPFSPGQILEWNRRLTEEEAETQYRRTIQIEQECAPYLTAVVQGNTPEEIYTRVKEIIKEQSAPIVWVPSLERL